MAAADRASIAQRVSHLRAVLAAADGHLDPAIRRRAEYVIAKAEARRELAPDVMVAAVFGATGTGKSSLVNAIAGAEVADVGVIRPTTQQATAVASEVQAAELLDWLGITTLTTGPALPPGMVLVDTPDIDSIVTANHVVAARLLAAVDVCLWVVDPLKYADAELWVSYLDAARELAPVSVVVLNRIDTVSPPEADAVKRDLARLLTDRFGTVPIMRTSAVTGAGVAKLRAKLADLTAQVRESQARLHADVDGVVAAIEPTLGSGELPALPTSRELVSAVADAAGAGAVADLAAADYRLRTQQVAGWPITALLSRLRRDPLRRLRLGRRGEDPRAIDISKLPAPTPVATAAVSAAGRDFAHAAAHGLPETWAQEVRQLARTDVSLTAMNADLAEISLDRPNRAWWQMARLLHWSFLVATVVCVVWLAVPAVLGFLQLQNLPMPHLGPVPWPTALLLGGIAGAVLTSLLVRLGRHLGAERSHRRTVQAVERAVAAHVDRHIIEPVTAVRERLRTARQEVAAAASK